MFRWGGPFFCTPQRFWGLIDGLLIGAWQLFEAGSIAMNVVVILLALKQQVN
jgi:hypothetical protein